MSEQFRDHAEHNEATAELEAARQEKLEELRNQPEAASEHAEKRAEAAREVINRQEHAPQPDQGETEGQAAAKPVFRLDHKIDYAHTMASVRAKLSPVSRSFSKVIHAPIIEKASEALEETVARPSVVAGSTWTALIVGGAFYISARTFGFALSGSELLFSFIIGAVLGLSFEFLGRRLRRKP